MSDSIVQRLKEWGSCDIADGLSKALGHKHGGFLDGLTVQSPLLSPSSGQTSIVGRAFTVKFVPIEDNDSPRMKNSYIDLVPEGAVLFISQPPPHLGAVYGGLMSLRAKVLGVAGVVVDGRVRDIQEHRKLGLPVFCHGLGTTAAAGRTCRLSEVQVPVKLSSEDQEAWIAPGDFIIADENGVVCLPAELAEAVLAALPAMVEADRRCAEGITQGRSVDDVFREFRGK